jgi:hypothetical protein
MADANLVLLDSLVTQAANGDLIVGRGVPDDWVTSGRDIAVSNFPTTNGQRLSIRISTRQRAVTLAVSGSPSGPVLLQLPQMVNNIASSSSGRIDQATGTVALPSSAKRVTIHLRHSPA